VSTHARNAADAGRMRPLIDERRKVERLTVTRFEAAQVAGVLSKFGQVVTKLPDAPLLRLSARTPWHATLGRLDSFEPGRWDTELDLVFMLAIRQVGQSPGEWDGTVVYGHFVPPAAGHYLLVGNFSGYETTMSMTGPWGVSTAYTATTSDHHQVSALWTGSEEFDFSLSCTGAGMGYLESLQVFEL
jgi:hypothetical protein